MMQDPQPYIRLMAIQHKNVSERILYKLMSDKRSEISQAAKIIYNTKFGIGKQKESFWYKIKNTILK